jgi:hypothetical protein
MKLKNMINVSSDITKKELNSIKRSFEELIEAFYVDDPVEWVIDEWPSDDYNAFRFVNHPKDDPLLSFSETYLFKNLNSMKIFLVGEEDFCYMEQNCYHRELIDYQSPPTEVFGMYLTCPFPQILVCPERIRGWTQHNGRITFKMLFLKVLIHEIVHFKLNSGVRYGKRDLFYKWMEESMANFIALNALYYFFKLCRRNMREFNELRLFCKKQPDNYAFGEILFEIEKESEKGEFYAQYSKWFNGCHQVNKKRTKKWLDIVTNIDFIDYDKLVQEYNRLYKN